MCYSKHSTIELCPELQIYFSITESYTIYLEHSRIINVQELERDGSEIKITCCSCGGPTPTFDGLRSSGTLAPGDKTAFSGLQRHLYISGPQARTQTYTQNIFCKTFGRTNLYSFIHLYTAEVTAHKFLSEIPTHKIEHFNVETDVSNCL